MDVTEIGGGTPVPQQDWEWEASFNAEKKKTARIGPANNGADRERLHQIERLQRIREDVQELETFANAGGKIIIIDTNTLMHALPLDEIQWTRNGVSPGETVRALERV